MSTPEIAAARQEVIDHARWWRDHDGAPGRKLTDALNRLDDLEGRARAGVRDEPALVGPIARIIDARDGHGSQAPRPALLVLVDNDCWYAVDPDAPEEEDVGVDGDEGPEALAIDALHALGIKAECV